MNTNPVLHALLLALVATTAACASKTEDVAASSEDAIEQASEDPDAIEMDVDDLDADGVKETFKSTRMSCGTGGCTWSIHLSTLGYAGETFAHNVVPLAQGTGDRAASFFAESRGGYCHVYLTRFTYEGDRYVENGKIDCNEVIKRPEGSPISQYELQCGEILDPECKNRP